MFDEDELTEKFAEIEKRLWRMERLNSEIVREREVARDQKQAKIYKGWLQLDPAEALSNLLALNNYGKEQCLKTWGYDGARSIVAIANPKDQADLIARGNFSDVFVRDMRFALNPESIPRYFKIHSAPKRGWVRSPVVVSHKAALALDAAGLIARFSAKNNVNRFGDVTGPDRETTFWPPSWQPDEWILFTERQLACLQKYDDAFNNAVADKGLSIEVLTPEECRGLALNRNETRPPGPVLVELPEEPEAVDPWDEIKASYAARAKAGA